MLICQNIAIVTLLNVKYVQQSDPWIGSPLTHSDVLTRIPNGVSGQHSGFHAAALCSDTAHLDTAAPSAFQPLIN